MHKIKSGRLKTGYNLNNQHKRKEAEMGFYIQKQLKLCIWLLQKRCPAYREAVWLKRQAQARLDRALLSTWWETKLCALPRKLERGAPPPPNANRQGLGTWPRLNWILSRQGSKVFRSLWNFYLCELWGTQASEPLWDSSEALFWLWLSLISRTVLLPFY